MTEVRLHVFLSRAGVASRRRAERYIKEGRVTVNGETVQTLGTRVRPGEDAVAFDGEEVGKRQPPTTLLLHKPVEVVTTLSDPEGRETVADLIQAEPYRFLPVGRLDYHTEGLLLMTTDGELTNRLLHPRYHVPKVYHVRVRGRPSREALGALRDGVELEDGRTQPAVTEVLEEGERHTWLEIVVSEGRNRLVRRMCEQIGHPAQRVLRTELATLPLGEIKPGQYRYLSTDELTTLYKVAQLGSAPKLSPRAEQVQGLWLGEPRRGRGRRPGEAHRPPGFAGEPRPEDADRGAPKDSGRGVDPRSNDRGRRDREDRGWQDRGAAGRGADRRGAWQDRGARGGPGRDRRGEDRGWQDRGAAGRGADRRGAWQDRSDRADGRRGEGRQGGWQDRSDRSHRSHPSDRQGADAGRGADRRGGWQDRRGPGREDPRRGGWQDQPAGGESRRGRPGARGEDRGWQDHRGSAPEGARRGGWQDRSTRSDDRRGRPGAGRGEDRGWQDRSARGDDRSGRGDDRRGGWQDRPTRGGQRPTGQARDGDRRGGSRADTRRSADPRGAWQDRPGRGDSPRGGRQDRRSRDDDRRAGGQDRRGPREDHRDRSGAPGPRKRGGPGRFEAKPRGGKKTQLRPRAPKQPGPKD